MSGVLSLMGRGSTDVKCLENSEHRDSDEPLPEELRITVGLYLI